MQLHAGALVIAPDQLFTSHSKQLAALTVRHALPAIYEFRPFVAYGGLMSCGDKPADLPVQQSTKIELIINLKTAKTLGITVPLPLSGRADELIE
jgi:putative ABC transport system substrate-binding protein